LHIFAFQYPFSSSNIISICLLLCKCSLLL